MVELLVGLVTGTVATTLLHWKARRRSAARLQSKKQLPSTEPVSEPSKGAISAAIIFMSVAPEVAAQMFSHLGPEMVQTITFSISNMGPIDPEKRKQTIAQFCESLGIAEGRFEEAASQEPALIAKALSALVGSH